MNERLESIRDIHHASTGGDLPVPPKSFDTVCIGALALSLAGQRRRWWHGRSRTTVREEDVVPLGEVLAQYIWPSFAKMVVIKGSADRPSHE